MRSRTDSPCPRTAEVEILGVAFCGACAREQEAYFAIGELTQRTAGRGAGENPVSSRGKYGSQSECKYGDFGLDSQRNHAGSFDWLNLKGTPVYSDLRRNLLVDTRPPLGGCIG